MNEKDFMKKEPLLLKLCYLLGGVFFLLSLNEVTKENSTTHVIFPIIAFSMVILLLVRLFIYAQKNE